MCLPFKPFQKKKKAEQFETKVASENGAGGSVEILPPPPPVEDDILNWFFKSGPSLSKIHTLLVPDLDRTLPPAWSNKGPNEVYAGMSHLLDPHSFAGKL